MFKHRRNYRFRSISISYRMGRDKTGNLHCCMICNFTAPRYLVNSHYLKKHISAEEVPYACVRCVAKFLTKRKADAHLRAHPGLEFRNVFKGTYVDTVAPQIRRLTDAEDEQHRMKPKELREDMLKELYNSPKEQEPTDYLEETVAERIPSKRQTEDESAAAKKPRIAEEEVAALNEGKGEDRADVEQEVEIEVHAPPPPIDDVDTSSVSTQTREEWKPDRVVPLLEAILSYSRRTAHALERMASSPPPPPPVAPPVNPPRRVEQTSSASNVRRDDRRPWRRDRQ